MIIARGIDLSSLKEDQETIKQVLRDDGVAIAVDNFGRTYQPREKFFTTDQAYKEHPQNVLASVWRKTNNPQELDCFIPSPLPRL